MTKFSPDVEKTRRFFAEMPESERAKLQGLIRDAAQEVQRQEPDAARVDALLFPNGNSSPGQA